MIRLSFVTGGSLRKVTLENNKIAMMTPETNMVPMVFDLDKLEDNPKFKDMNVEQRKLFEEIKLLKTEEEKAKDIIKDFQRTGWRLLKRE